MQHDGHLLEGQRVARHIRFDEAEPPLAPQRGEVALLHGTRVEGIEVVDPDDFVPPPDQRLAHVGADEPRGPGDQDPQAHLQTSVRKYSRSEEHTSELQSQSNLVCRLLLEKKKKIESTLITVIQILYP